MSVEDRTTSEEDPVGAFAAAATDADAVVHRTTTADAPAIIDSLVRDPAVGAPLPFEGVSLPDGVETDPNRESLVAAETGITAAVLGIVDHGSVAISPDDRQEGPISLYPSRQIAVVRATDLVPDLPTALARLDERFRAGGDAVLVTGPSTTGDMGELVTGVHGPAELHVVVIKG